MRGARGGDRDDLSELYLRYFGRIYDFLARLTRDRDEAADLAQDAFVRASQRLDQLRDPDKFRPWLFSIAYRQAIDRMARNRRSVAVDPGLPGAFDEVAAGTADPVRSAELKELAQLVWEGASTLDERTYAVLDLHVRQGLDSGEIAEVLGVSATNASTMVHRMRARMERSIGALVLARRGSVACPGLAAVVANTAPEQVSRSTVRAIDRHAAGCTTCDETRRRVASPTAIMAAWAAVPAPTGLRDAVEKAVDRAVAGSRRTGRRTALAGIVTAALVLVVLLVPASPVLDVVPAVREPIAHVEEAASTRVATPEVPPNQSSRPTFARIGGSPGAASPAERTDVVSRPGPDDSPPPGPDVTPTATEAPRPGGPPDAEPPLSSTQPAQRVTTTVPAPEGIAGTPGDPPAATNRSTTTTTRAATAPSITAGPPSTVAPSTTGVPLEATTTTTRPPGTSSTTTATTAPATTTTEARPVTTTSKPLAPPQVRIVDPADGAEVCSPVALRGSATDGTGSAIPGRSLTWTSSRDGVLGSGGELEVALTAGVHQLVVNAVDQTGSSASAAVAAKVLERTDPGCASLRGTEVR